jgi:TolA-binding protein
VRLQLQLTIHASPELLQRLDALLGLLERRDSTMSTQLHEMRASLDRLEQRVTEQTTVSQSAVTLIQGLADQLREAAAGQDLDSVRQRINNLTAQLDTHGDALAAAVAANTPGAVPPGGQPTQPDASDAVTTPTVTVTDSNGQPSVVPEPEAPAPGDPVPWEQRTGIDTSRETEAERLGLGRVGSVAPDALPSDFASPTPKRRE